MVVKKLINSLLCAFWGGVKLARRQGVSIGEDCHLVSMPKWGSEPWLITLGNHIEVSSDVHFITHDGSTWVFRNQDRYKDVIRYGKIEIKDNCFIGARTTMLQGVSIGPNSVVGACSLVNNDVEPNSVYAGIPAKRICSIEEYAEKCLSQTPDYNKQAYKDNKQKEVLRVLAKSELDNNHK